MHVICYALKYIRGTGQNFMTAIVLMIQNDANPSCLHDPERCLMDQRHLLEEVLPTTVSQPELWPIVKVATAPAPRLYVTHLATVNLPASILSSARVRIISLGCPKFTKKQIPACF